MPGIAGCGKAAFQVSPARKYGHAELTEITGITKDWIVGSSSF
jgi:hypothetical protein